MSDDPKRRDTHPGFSLPPEALADVLKALDGPRESIPVGDRVTLEVCPGCGAEGMLVPHVAEDLRAAIEHWKASGSPGRRKDVDE